jgi:tripartite-type tricarboxylate transporter receptor subunit TctC
VPTFAEAGLPDYSPTAWIGLFAPAGTPKPDRRQARCGHAEGGSPEPGLIEKWRSYGGELKAMTPDEFAAFIRTDSAMWGDAIRKAGIKLDQ